jgi:hypothetical protein
MSPFAFFGVVSFFIRDLLNEPINKGSDSAPLFMVLISCVKCLLNFQLTLLAVSTLVLTQVFGEQSFIDASGYISSTSLKTSTPLQASLVRKIVRAFRK